MTTDTPATALPLACPLTHEQLIALAIDIADAASRSDIECYTCGERVDTTNWWDTSLILPDVHALRPVIDRALRYLDARGLVHRSVVSPHRVCFPATLWEARG